MSYRAECPWCGYRIRLRVGLVRRFYIHRRYDGEKCKGSNMTLADADEFRHERRQQLASWDANWDGGAA